MDISQTSFKLDSELSIQGKTEGATLKTELIVEGMSCSHCVRAVETEIGRISGVRDVKVNLEKKTVIVEHDDLVSNEDIAEAISEAGFALL